MIMKIQPNNFHFTLLLITLSLWNCEVFAQETNRFQEEVLAIEKKIQQDNPAKGGILFTGSSSIRLWKNLDSSFPETHIINTGFGGSQTVDLLVHLESLVLDFEPNKIFIYEGDNDVNSGKSTVQIIATYKELIGKIFQRLPESHIYLISAKPSPSRWHLKEKFMNFNEELEKISHGVSTITYIDVWNPMLDEKGDPKSDLFIQDNLHMNDKGYDIWKTVFLPYVF
jgi:lysophospholipase L1-like esterase